MGLSGRAATGAPAVGAGAGGGVGAPGITNDCPSVIRSMSTILLALATVSTLRHAGAPLRRRDRTTCATEVARATGRARTGAGDLQQALLGQPTLGLEALEPGLLVVAVIDVAHEGGNRLVAGLLADEAVHLLGHL